MMSKLYAFGCSWTYGQNTSDWYKNREVPSARAWPQLIANKLDLTCVNLAKSGASNDYILHTILKYCNNFTNHDLVLVMMTWPDRKLVNTGNIGPGRPKDKNYYIKYHTEELGYLNLIQNFLSIQTILQDLNYWITFTDFKPILKSKEYFPHVDFKKRVIKPPRLSFNRFIDSAEGRHPNNEGHKKISEFLLNFFN